MEPSPYRLKHVVIIISSPLTINFVYYNCYTYHKGAAVKQWTIVCTSFTRDNGFGSYTSSESPRKAFSLDFSRIFLYAHSPRFTIVPFHCLFQTKESCWVGDKLYEQKAPMRFQTFWKSTALGTIADIRCRSLFLYLPSPEANLGLC